VVVVVIGMLVALLLTAVQSAREAARRAHCVNNIRQIALATHGTLSTCNQFPTGVFGEEHGWGPDSACWSWMARILPDIERADLYDYAGCFERPFRDFGVPNDGAATLIPLFLCPSDSQRTVRDTLFYNPDNHWAEETLPLAPSHYGGILSEIISEFGSQREADGWTLRNDELGSILMNRRICFAAITSGLSNTAMITEASSYETIEPPVYANGSWISGTNIFRKTTAPINYRPRCEHFNTPTPWLCSECSAYQYEMRSFHPSGAFALFADGSVHFLSATTAIEVIGRLCNRSQGL